MFKEVINKPFNKLVVKLNDVNQIDDLKFLSKKDAKTEVEISFLDKDKKLTFKLKDKRNVDRETINLLNKSNSVIITSYDAISDYKDLFEKLRTVNSKKIRDHLINNQ